MSALFWSRGLVLCIASLAACSGKSVGSDGADAGNATGGGANGGAATAGEPAGGAAHAGNASAGKASSGGGATVSSGGAASAGVGGGLALGQPCLPSDELVANFSGFALAEINLETDSPACASGICVADHFRGRVSCPYGQAEAGGGCTLPGSSAPVRVPVAPQVLERPPRLVVTCSCHCAGDGPGPYCTCPSGMECAPLVQKLMGIADPEGLSGSYCILNGSSYDASAAVTPCDAASMSCGDAHPF